jgi:mRNA interferase MazF
MTYRRGDVVIVNFPHSDGINYSKRPAIIVQSDEVETDLSQTLIAQITSNLARTGSTRVLVAQNTDLWRQMGLETDSVVVADNLATVKDYMIRKKIGHCLDMEVINIALRKALGL